MTRAEWKRMRQWLSRFLLAEAVLVSIFIWGCTFPAAQEPEILTVIKEVPVEVTVAPEEQNGPSEAAVALAKVMWGEARGCSTTEQAGVAWCVLNRADSDDPVEPELLALAEDVLARWELEQLCVGSVGRVLPSDYLYFEGDGRHNYFRQEYIGDGTTWDWSLASPYEEG